MDRKEVSVKMTIDLPKSFRAELGALLYKHRKGDISDTDNQILATYLESCLNAYDDAVNARDKALEQREREEL